MGIGDARGVSEAGCWGRWEARVTGDCAGEGAKWPGQIGLVKPVRASKGAGHRVGV